MKLEAFDKNNTNKKKFYLISSLVIALVITIVSLFTMSIYEVQTTDVSVVNATVKFNNAVLKSTTYSDTNAFRSSIYKEKIKTLTFEEGINIPATRTEEWNIADGDDETLIKAYVTPVEEGSAYYDLHIQSDAAINANEDMSYWFTGLSYLDSIEGLELVNFSNTKNMTYTFGGHLSNSPGYNSQIFTLDVSSIDTSNVTNMRYIFYQTGYNSQIFTLDLSNFDTSSVTNMEYMFYRTGYNNQNFILDVSNFNTSNVTNMRGMFYGIAFNNLSLVLEFSNWDTSNVTDMSWMFCGAYCADKEDNYSFTLDISSFDTSNVTNMSSMFYKFGLFYETSDCNFNYTHSNLLELDFYNFDTSKVTNTEQMFAKSGFVNLDLSSWNTSNLTYIGEEFVTSNSSSCSGMFYECFYLENLNISNFNTSKVTKMNSLFYDCYKLNNLDLNNWDTSKVTEMAQMFYKAGIHNQNFTLILGENFNTSKVTNMISMFEGTGFSNDEFTLDIRNFDTSNVTNMRCMFSSYHAGGFNKCRSYLKIIFGNNFNTSNVTDMTGMFSLIDKLELENYKGFDTSSVTKYGDSGNYGMFSNCKKINIEIDILIPSTNISNSNNYANMFYNAATEEGSEIKVNYTTENQSLVQAMVNTKYPSSNTNVHIGNLIPKHTITINDSNITSDLSRALKWKKITLISTLEGKGISSFKLNGTLINGNTFIMPDEDVEITDVVLIDQVIKESEHNPYLNSQNNVVYYEHTFEGATSITVELTYQTEGTSWDWIYLYTSPTTIYNNKKYGGSTKKTETITITGDYIKIVFRTDSVGNQYYGFEAVITPNYD